MPWGAADVDVCKRNAVQTRMTGDVKICRKIFDLPSPDGIGKPRQIHLAQNGGRPNSVDDAYFVDISLYLHYDAFCDDFGPVNILSVLNFVEAFDKCLPTTRCTNVVCFVNSGKRTLTNAVFLLGAYMILKLAYIPVQVLRCFDGVDENLLEPFRDATFMPRDFNLRLIDCWFGLHRAISKGWVAMPSSFPDEWGMISKDDYEHFDKPLNGDLHEVVPEKFVAFKGPKFLQGRKYYDHPDGYRDFSPTYYIDAFKDLGVSTVIRLNDIQYDANDFISKGIHHHNLYFEDCTPPPASIVTAFFDIVDKARGLIAIHCKAGLGRTGTLIALDMMRTDGFTAREAIGWLRIMRPGCVIGPQQQFLVNYESTLSPAIFRPFQADSETPPSLSHIDNLNDVTAVWGCGALAAAGRPIQALAVKSPSATAESASAAAAAATAAALAQQVSDAMQQRHTLRGRRASFTATSPCNSLDPPAHTTAFGGDCNLDSPPDGRWQCPSHGTGRRSSGLRGTGSFSDVRVSVIARPAGPAGTSVFPPKPVSAQSAGGGQSESALWLRPPPLVRPGTASTLAGTAASESAAAPAAVPSGQFIAAAAGMSRSQARTAGSAAAGGHADTGRLAAAADSEKALAGGRLGQGGASPVKAAAGGASPPARSRSVSDARAGAVNLRVSVEKAGEPGGLGEDSETSGLGCLGCLAVAFCHPTPKPRPPALVPSPTLAPPTRSLPPHVPKAAGGKPVVRI